jgi:hypothetical protein
MRAAPKWGLMETRIASYSHKHQGRFEQRSTC